MDELEVKKAVKKWIKSQHPDWYVRGAWHFDVVAGPSKQQLAIAVECKGHPSQRFKAQRAIGQCLDYTARTALGNVSCFIAIPEHFIYNNIMLDTLEYHNLPIGLLVVDDHGNVKVLREGIKKQKQTYS